jgi:hypothetical protein
MCRILLALSASLVVVLLGRPPGSVASNRGRDNAAADVDSTRSTISGQDAPAGWKPKGEYWTSYRSVFVSVVCDSMGHVKSADPMHSDVSAAETDSVLKVAKETTFDPKVSAGRLWWTKRETPSDPDLHYVVPFVMSPRETSFPPPPVSREDLVAAGLGPWLSIWDDLLPGWPFEQWSVRWTNRMYELPSDIVIADRDLLAYGMVSTSPDQRWRLHPFYGFGLESHGGFGRDADSGYVLYSTHEPRQARQNVTGTTADWSSAEWIDSSRFVVAGFTSVDLSIADKGVDYTAPVLIFGNVDSLEDFGITGPPVRVQDMPTLLSRLDAYTHKRYPKFWEASH